MINELENVIKGIDSAIEELKKERAEIAGLKSEVQKLKDEVGSMVKKMQEPKSPIMMIR